MDPFVPSPWPRSKDAPRAVESGRVRGAGERRVGGTRLNFPPGVGRGERERAREETAGYLGPIILSAGDSGRQIAPTTRSSLLRRHPICWSDSVRAT